MSVRTGLQGKGQEVPSGYRSALLPQLLLGPKWLLCKLNLPLHLPGLVCAAPRQGCSASPLGAGVSGVWGVCNTCISHADEAHGSTSLVSGRKGDVIKAARAPRSPA